MQLKKQTGFTLVEIAIVLVIVGLLIGGVLKGQEMITNAKLKRIESDNAGIAAAMFSYQDRYLQLPGDDNAADGRFSVYTLLLTPQLRPRHQVEPSMVPGIRLAVLVLKKPSCSGRICALRAWCRVEVRT